MAVNASFPTLEGVKIYDCGTAFGVDFVYGKVNDGIEHSALKKVHKCLVFFSLVTCSI